MYKRIRDLREDNDLYQSDVAEKLNIARSQYQKYEAGTTMIPVHIVIALAKLYNVSVDYLLGLTDVKKAAPPSINAEARKAIIYFNRLSEENRDYILGEMVKLHREQETKSKKKKDIG